METWESFFREKSRRRWREGLMKAAILTLLFASIAVAIYLEIEGLPR